MNVENTILHNIIFHYVGSKNNLEPVYLSKNAFQLEEEMSLAIRDNFLGRFKNNYELHAFHHNESLRFNEVYNYCSELFEDNSLFENVSQSIARHLYEASTHPKVKGGELYVVHFKGLVVDSRVHSAIGIFKTENKTLFLDARNNNGELSLEMKEGVELSKVDKGCLVINNNADSGYDVLLFDNQNRGEEAAYWKEKFLGLSPRENDFHHTKHLLTLTRQFITDGLEEELQVTRKDQVEMLNKSMDYFKTNETFDIEDFQQHVFQSDEMIDSFRKYGSRYVENNDYDIASQFDISVDAVKKQGRVYKNVLKLDRNFHIYIHGRTDLIEKGVDMDGRKYYKIYYQEEQ